jgi:profilin
MLRGFEDSIPLYSGGLYVAGERLMVTKADDQSIYAEKVRHFNCDNSWWLVKS